MTFRALLLIALLLAFAACESKPKAVRPIDAQETYGMLLNDFAVLIDVREPGESAVAQQAKLIPLSQIKSKGSAWTDFVKAHAKNKQVVFYGASEPDSKEAAELAAGEGLEARILGPYSAWTQAGLPSRMP